MKKMAHYILLSLGLLFVFSTAQAATLAQDLLRHPGDPYAGNPNGRITVVEFFDYQCSHCMNMASTIQFILSANRDVRIIFKDYPIRGIMSQYASLATLAANKQHKYYQLNHALLSTQSPLTEKHVLALARSVGINISQLQKDMKSASVKQQLEFNYALAQKINLNGTPAFFIAKTDAQTNGKINYVLGEMSRSELQYAINQARE